MVSDVNALAGSATTSARSCEIFYKLLMQIYCGELESEITLKIG